MNPDIQVYLRQLLIDAGQTNLDPALEKQLMQDLYTRLEDRLMLTIMDILTPDQQDELEQMTEDQKSQAEIEDFLKKNIANYQQVFSNVLIEFRNLYIQNARNS